MENIILSIGMYLEEAFKVLNKDVKYIRQFNTKKMSRLHSVQDLIHEVLQSLDLFQLNLSLFGYQIGPHYWQGLFDAAGPAKCYFKKSKFLSMQIKGKICYTVNNR